ncbi:MAG: DMT family transporter, partial [Bacteroidota bacterium]
LGLTLTSACNSGFITGMNVVIVALLAAACGSQRLNRRTLAGTVLATSGMVLLAWHPGGWRFSRGDLLTLACAVFFAAHIVATGVLAPGRDPVRLAGIQFLAVALAGLGWHVLTGGGVTPPAGRGWLALVYLGLGGTGFAFLVQTAAQRRTSAVDTAVIFSTEPLFAAAFAVLFGGERLSAQMLLGGVAIFAATLLAILAPGPPAAAPGSAQEGARPVRSRPA